VAQYAEADLFMFLVVSHLSFITVSVDSISPVDKPVGVGRLSVDSSFTPLSLSSAHLVFFIAIQHCYLGLAAPQLLEGFVFLQQ